MVQSSDTGATLMSAATGPDVSGAPPNGNDRSAMLKADHDRWGPIVKTIGFTADS